jgi:oxygen-dependent protoporphyrinogen oxidase
LKGDPASVSASVIVVGGGLAGLTAAYTLQKRGIAVEVLEQEATPGGRMRSEAHNGFIVERGAQFIASSYRNMHALAAELGIADRITPLSNTRNAVLKNGRFMSAEYEGLKAIGRSRDLSWPSKLRLFKLLWHVWRQRRLLDFYRPEVAAPLDGESAAEYSRRELGREVLDYLIDPAFASTFTALPENLSKAFLLVTIATMLGGFRLQSFRGGNGLLTQTLAERVPVRLGAQVARIEPDADGVAVRLRDGEPRRADAVVVAVPGNVAGGLCEGLTASEEAFFGAVRYAASIVVFVMTSDLQADPGVYGVGIPRCEGVGLYGLAVENPKEGVVPPGKTMFNCAISEAMAEGLFCAPDDVVVEAVHGELAKLPLRGLDRVEGHAVHRWPALVPRFYPGYHRALGRFFARGDRSERLFFAGDYLVGPYTEAALTSGLRAADEAAAGLMPS